MAAVFEPAPIETLQELEKYLGRFDCLEQVQDLGPLTRYVFAAPFMGGLTASSVPPAMLRDGYVPYLNKLPQSEMLMMIGHEYLYMRELGKAKKPEITNLEIVHNVAMDLYYLVMTLSNLSSKIEQN